MISQPFAAPHAPSSPATAKLPPLTPGGSVASPLVDASIRIGVGIDTARYGHYAAFLRDDLQPAAVELAFTESAAGYAQLRARFEQIVAKHVAHRVHFHVRLDAAGQYADNLVHFLRFLAGAAGSAGTVADATPLASAQFTLSCGDPQRNKNYRAALFGPHKSDPLEARAAARYALNERPMPAPLLSTELRQLRQVAGRLQSVVKQRTRLINQLHQLLVHAFPELATLVKDISIGWVLELLTRYPTAALLAAARQVDLDNVPYLPAGQIAPLLEAARTSIASLTGDLEAELVRDQIRQLRDVCARQKRLENMLIQAYRRLPELNGIDTIPGIGDVTAAILTAFILDIRRFDSPFKLVAYFGVLPVEVSSGVDRDGTPRGPKRYVMSKRGNDLVRRYLWMAALSAVRFNPAVRALYARVVAKHPQRKAIAIGHAMRKLLHLVFAIWTSGKPFDPQHGVKRSEVGDPSSEVGDQRSDVSNELKDDDASLDGIEQAAGLKPDMPALQEVTAACPDIVREEAPVCLPLPRFGGEGRSEGVLPAIPDDAYLDFAHLKKQLPLARVLDHLGLSQRLKGSGVQKRCACPIHRGDGRGRTFCVNLDQNVFSCHKCKATGDAIDLWAALHHQNLRQAALDLTRTFGLEPAPTKRTEKRNG